MCRWLICHLFGDSCSFGLLVVILVISNFGFEGGTLVLIATDSGHCYLLLLGSKMIVLSTRDDQKLHGLSSYVAKSKALVNCAVTDLRLRFRVCEKQGFFMTRLN